MKSINLVLFAILILESCGQSRINTPANAKSMFNEFRTKQKFLPDSVCHFPGTQDAELRSILHLKMNQVADDFEMVAQNETATAKEYQEKIKIGLARFNDIYIILDTEDRERICTYFEELMDIVGLESSAGQLNTWMYGFDPNEKPDHGS